MGSIMSQGIKRSDRVGIALREMEKIMDQIEHIRIEMIINKNIDEHAALGLINDKMHELDTLVSETIEKLETQIRSDARYNSNIS